jgi:hypothetical protein
MAPPVAGSGAVLATVLAGAPWCTQPARDQLWRWVRQRVTHGCGDLLGSIPASARVRDNRGPPGFAVHLKTDPDRANISGVSNLDVAGASSTAMNGHNLTVLRDGDEQIPIVARIMLFDFIEEMHANGSFPAMCSSCATSESRNCRRRGHLTANEVRVSLSRGPSPLSRHPRLGAMIN